MEILKQLFTTEIEGFAVYEHELLDDSEVRGLCKNLAKERFSLYAVIPNVKSIEDIQKIRKEIRAQKIMVTQNIHTMNHFPMKDRSLFIGNFIALITRLDVNLTNYILKRFPPLSKPS